MLAALAPCQTVKSASLSPSNPGRARAKETWSSATADGLWKIDRVESPGTPWCLIDQRSGEDAGFYGTQRKARQAIANGGAEMMLERARTAEVSLWASEVQDTGQDSPRLARFVSQAQQSTKVLSESAYESDQRTLASTSPQRVRWCDARLRIVEAMPPSPVRESLAKALGDCRDIWASHVPAADE